MGERSVRHVHLLGVVGQIRTAKYENRDHIIVPVVALMEGVIHAINAETPEYVPISCLMSAPQGWNGRPVMFGHPTRDGHQISANDPKVLAEKSFGRVFQSRISGKKLLLDAWVDPDKARKIGAERLLERVQNGEQVEVSVGAFVVTENTAGDYNGKPYKAIWRDLIPDHLAFLQQGTGACSVAMGCGTHRAAQQAEGEQHEEHIVHHIVDDHLEVLIGNGNNQYTDDNATKGDESALGEDPSSKAKLRIREVGAGFDITGELEMWHPDHPGDKVLIEKLPDAPYSISADGPNSIKTGPGSKGSILVYHGSKAVSSHKTIKDAKKAARVILHRDRTIKGLQDAHVERLITAIGNGNNQYTEGNTGRIEVPAEKDARRIADIIHKSQGSKEKKLQLTRQMAKSITNLDKAMRRGNAAFKIHQKEVADVFFARADELRAAEDTMTENVQRALALVREGMPMKDAVRECKLSDDETKECKAAIADDDDEEPEGKKKKFDFGKFKGAEMTKELRAAAIKALVECPVSGFTTDDVKLLESVSDERLVAFAEATEARQETVTKLTTAEAKITETEAKVVETEAKLKVAAEKVIPPAAESKPLTEEEFMKAAPASIKTLVERQKKSDAERKTTLIAELKTAQSEYKEDELKTMGVEELARLARVANIAEPADNYVGRGVPRAASERAEDPYLNPPDPYAPGLEARRKGQAVN